MRPVVRDPFRRVLMGGVIALLILAGAGTTLGGTATILVSDLNVRSAPDIHQKVLFRLARQSRVRVLERKGGWLKIEHEGRRGYIVDRPEWVTVRNVATPGHRTNGPTDDADKQKLKEMVRQAESLNERLKSSQTLLVEMTGKEKSLLDELNRVEQVLNETRRQVRAARMELEPLKEKVAALEQQQGQLEKQIQEAEAYTAQRLVALYKLGWIGRMQLLATASSFYDLISRKAALARILVHDEALLEKLRRDQTALATIVEQLNEGKAQRLAAQMVLDRRIEQLRSEQAGRAGLLETVRGRKEYEHAALKALRQAAEELDGMIGRLKAEPAPRPAAPPVPIPNDVFEQSKGLLQWPVRGKIVSSFGPYRDEKTNLQNFQSGIDIKAERGEPVRAVSGGYTIYANWFKGLGNMIIIDHGSQYYTVYAHLEEVFKVKGDRVEKDEVIATVGDSGSMMGPGLRFEVRHRGKPVDPMQWINKG
jgi:murein hydrolase activator